MHSSLGNHRGITFLVLVLARIVDVAPESGPIEHHTLSGDCELNHAASYILAMIDDNIALYTSVAFLKNSGQIRAWKELKLKWRL